MIFRKYQQSKSHYKGDQAIMKEAALSRLIEDSISTRFIVSLENVLNIKSAFLAAW